MNKFIFYILSFTWGLLFTLIGLVVGLVLIIAGYRPKKYGWCYYFEIGKNWGGLDLGLIFIVDKSPSEHVKKHEHGHAIQNCYFGPFMIFMVCIPSTIRYWYRELKYYKKHRIPSTGYDDIWFEGQATKLGEKYSLKYNWR